MDGFRGHYFFVCLFVFLEHRHLNAYSLYIFLYLLIFLSPKDYGFYLTSVLTGDDSDLCVGCIDVIEFVCVVSTLGVGVVQLFYVWGCLTS